GGLCPSGPAMTCARPSSAAPAAASTYTPSTLSQGGPGRRATERPDLRPHRWHPHAPVGRAERRLSARLFGRWRSLSAVLVWPIGWSPVLYIYTSLFLGRMSESA